MNTSHSSSSFLPPLIGISGKVASGKDTISLALAGRIDADYDYAPVKVKAFADPLKQEMSDVIAILAEAPYLDALQALNEAYSEIAVDDLVTIFDVLCEDVYTGKAKDGWSRSKGVRSALQIWSTFRKADEPDYWVQKAFADIQYLRRSDCPVLITDLRFENEANAILDHGGAPVRLDVSPAELARRLSARDGIALSPEQQQHPSEVDLDGYKGFSMRVINESRPTDQVVQQIIDELSRLNYLP